MLNRSEDQCIIISTILTLCSRSCDIQHTSSRFNITDRAYSCRIEIACRCCNNFCTFCCRDILICYGEWGTWSYPRNMDTGLSEVLVFKLFRTEAATPTVPPPPIVITFDIIKHRCPHYFPADKVFSMDTFHFQRMKEAFHAGIIVAATFCAHTSTQIMPLQLRLIICWTVLASTVRVNDNVPGPLTPP